MGSDKQDSGVPRPRTYIVSTYHLAVDQKSLQVNWSLYRKKRHRPDRRTVPPPGARLIHWTNRVEVTCGTCRKKLGSIVAFSGDDLYGVVEDKAQPTLEAALGDRTGQRTPWLTVSGDGQGAIAHFHCRRCNRNYRRNAHRLGQSLTEENASEFVLR